MPITTQSFNEILKNELLILDGAMGTMLMRRGLEENTFRGELFKEHEHSLLGFYDLLCLTQPDIVADIHKAYICAGADIITTNTFCSNTIMTASLGLNSDTGIVYELNKKGAEIARSVADNQNRRVIVAGSVGPTHKTITTQKQGGCGAFMNVEYSELLDSYMEQLEGLIDGGADLLLFETVFDTANLRAGLEAAGKVMYGKSINLPMIASATIDDRTGLTLSGQNLAEFALCAEENANVVAIGLNCCNGPEGILRHLECLKLLTPLHITTHPSAGMPDAKGDYMISPETFARILSEGASEIGIRIIGGCCGTTPSYTSALKRFLAPA